jgi:hypothetical protein
MLQCTPAFGGIQPHDSCVHSVNGPEPLVGQWQLERGLQLAAEIAAIVKGGSQVFLMMLMCLHVHKRGSNRFVNDNDAFIAYHIT